MGVRGTRLAISLSAPVSIGVLTGHHATHGSWVGSGDFQILAIRVGSSQEALEILRSGTGQVRPEGFKSHGAGSDRIGSGRVGSGRVGLGWVWSGRVG